MVTYWDLEQDKKRDEENRKKTSFDKRFDTGGKYSKGREVTEKNKEKARVFGKGLGLSDKRIEELINRQTGINLITPLSDTALGYVINYMIKESTKG